MPEGLRLFRKVLKSEVYSKIVDNRDNGSYLNWENGHISAVFYKEAEILDGGSAVINKERIKVLA